MPRGFLKSAAVREPSVEPEEFEVPARGVTVPLSEVVEVTVRVAVPEMDPEVAVRVVVPAATAVARPPVEMVAAEVVEELQVTEEVRSLVLLSEKVPVAMNCWVPPTSMLWLLGVTFMETGVELLGNHWKPQPAISVVKIISQKPLFMPTSP